MSKEREGSVKEVMAYNQEISLPSIAITPTNVQKWKVVTHIWYGIYLARASGPNSLN